MIEQLEFRRLFSGASLQNGILKLIGTDDADNFALAQERETEVDATGDVKFVNHLKVSLEGEFLGDFSYANINKVVVKLMGGNDLFTVGKKLLPFDIDGGDGDDTISGGKSGDIIRGGAGQNELTGGKGNDHFICNAGGDILTGGLGNDTADFSPFTSSLNISLDEVANDSEAGRAGNVRNDIETIIGGGGADIIDCTPVVHPMVIFGGGGNDTIYGGRFDDSIHGGPGNDSLRGNVGSDYMNGDGGRDRLFGEDGLDTLNGGGPDPEFIPLPTAQVTDQDTVGGGTDGSVDTLDGGAGQDVAIVDPFDIPRNL